ncbi:hypothetical protein [Shimia thalassica]|uniref:hypothetical protein n=1 Tax=Shimia thalassica TaxID=1715693 RepID=UPI0026E1F64D|nr:hypothetical protein [Shimia thalassica]MDO6484949.1 hypothetical protein [Shimia thalassica]
MTRLIIHAGTHKTGTTSLQRSMAANTEMMAAKGVYYPVCWEYFYKNRPEEQSVNAHFALARCIAQQKDNQKKNLDKFFTHLNKVGRDFDTVIISAESIYRHFDETASGDLPLLERRRLFLARLAEYFSEFDAEIALLFRRPDLFAESLYGEVIANSIRFQTFETTVRNQKQMYNYQLQIDLFSDFFPVSALSFEQACKEGLLSYFFSQLEVPVSLDEPSGNLRTSLKKQAVMWLQRSKMDAESMPDIERKRRWLFALQDTSAYLFGGTTKFSFWQSSEQRDRFLRNSLSTLKSLDFELPMSEIGESCFWNDELHAKAEAAYKGWVNDNLSWIEARELNNIAPFDDFPTLS